jgi:hypothetical protein
MRTKITDLTADVLRKLSTLSGINYDMLRHYASGRRGAKSLTAIKIERAARRLRLDIRREDLNNGCAQCEFARACRKTAGPTKRTAK